MSSSPVATHPPGAAAPVSAAADDARAVTIDLAPPSADDIALFAVTRAAVDRCAIAAWLPAFRAHTIRTRLIALPAEFVAYLDGATDGVMRLPRGVAPTTTGAAPSRFRDDDSECSEGDGDSDNNDDDDDDSHHFQNGGELTAADREWLRECQLKAEQFERVRTALSAAKANATQTNHASSLSSVSSSASATSAASAASAPSVSAVEAALSAPAPGASSEGRANDASNDEASDDDGDCDAGSDSDRDDGPEFPELVDEIETAIEALGGAVFPKLNWSAPKDASWIACNESLRCESVGDILLLLKSSEFVSHDLAHAYDDCAPATASSDPALSAAALSETVSIVVAASSSSELSPPTVAAAASSSPPPHSTAPAVFHLALRKWSNLLPSREFRCFVIDRQLVGVCQRDHANFYEHLTRAATRERIEDAIVDFFVAHVRRGFAVDPNYIFDVYVDKAFRVWLLDFGPFSFVTDSLLFSHLRDFAPLLRAQRAGLPLPPTLSSQASSAASPGSDATAPVSEPVSSSSSPPSVPPSALPTASSSSAASAQQWFEFEFRIVASQQSVVPSNTMHYRLPKEIIEMSNAADL